MVYAYLVDVHVSGDGGARLGTKAGDDVYLRNMSTIISPAESDKTGKIT